ncbi:MAG: T9SS type A sorting domain-containing protein [Bacteroidia bacterium]|nr:T9SS type A sorting domain-containing protein [Bacteroidia bacterium]
MQQLSKSYDDGPEVLVFPNPCQGHVKVQWRLGNSVAKAIEVYSLNGHLVHTTDVEPFPQGVQDIELSNLPDGAYVLKVEAGGDSVSEMLFVLG